MAADPTREGPGLRPGLHLAAAVLLGQAVALERSGFSPPAVACVGGAIVLVGLALLLPDGTGRPQAKAVTRAVIGIGVVSGLSRLPLVDLYLTVPAARPRVQPFVLLAAASAVLAIVVLVGRPRVARAALPVLIATFSLMGAFYLGISSDPRIDVYVVQRVGCDALLRGADPYATTFPNPYGRDTRFFPPGLVVDGRVQCGYPYPPVPLLMAVPAEVIAGDVRYAELAAYVLTAVLIAYGVRRRPDGSRPGTGPAVLLLFTPGVFRLLENAWIEPFLMLLLTAVTLAAARRWLGRMAVAAGLLLAAKQYVPLTAPAFLLLLPRRAPAGRVVAVAAVAALSVTLPFVVWNPRAFVHSLTVLNVGMIRADSVSFLPPLLRVTGWRVPLLAYPATAAAVAGGLVLWRGRRTPAGFAAGFALVCLCTFALSPLSFGNYYALAAAALLVAAAAEG